MKGKGKKNWEVLMISSTKAVYYAIAHLNVGILLERCEQLACDITNVASLSFSTQREENKLQVCHVL